MRDDQTGTYWQQISGKAVSGPLRGRQLTLIHSDELNFGTWAAEQPAGTVLQDDPKYRAEYAPKDWDAEMQRARVVIDFHEHGLKGRDLMLGIQAFGASRAYLYDDVLREKLIQDRIGGRPVLLVVASDGQSVRAFRNPDDFYRKPDGTLMDASTGSDWNFRGCAVAGPAKGTCLDPIAMLKDYWFDWRNYNPQTTVYGRK